MPTTKPTVTPLTIDQLRAAMDPGDWQDHLVTERDAALLGLGERSQDATAKIFAWLRARGWSPDQVLSSVKWVRGAEFIWLERNPQQAATFLVRALRTDVIARDCKIEQTEQRAGLEILAEIAAVDPSPEDRRAVEEWTRR